VASVEMCLCGHGDARHILHAREHHADGDKLGPCGFLDCKCRNFRSDNSRREHAADARAYATPHLFEPQKVINTIGVDAVRRAVAGLFLIVDEADNGAASWWVVYMCGVKVYGSPDEDAAGNFRNKLHAYVLRSMGIRP
jgi:hypothetical protein